MPKEEAKNIGEVVGENLKRIRVERDQTQEEAARFLSFYGAPRKRNYVTDLENGRRETLSIEELFTLSWAYMVPLKVWFRGEGRVKLQEGHDLPLFLLFDWLQGSNRSDPDRDPAYRIARAAVDVRYNPSAGLLDHEDAEDEDVDEQVADKVLTGLTDVQLAAWLDHSPRGIAKASRAIWGRRTSKELRSRLRRTIKHLREAYGDDIELLERELKLNEEPLRVAVARSTANELASYLRLVRVQDLETDEVLWKHPRTLVQFIERASGDETPTEEPHPPAQGQTSSSQAPQDR